MAVFQQSLLRSRKSHVNRNRLAAGRGYLIEWCESLVINIKGLIAWVELDSHTTAPCQMAANEFHRSLWRGKERLDIADAHAVAQELRVMTCYLGNRAVAHDDTMHDTALYILLAQMLLAVLMMCYTRDFIEIGVLFIMKMRINDLHGHPLPLLPHPP